MAWYVSVHSYTPVRRSSVYITLFFSLLKKCCLIHIAAVQDQTKSVHNNPLNSSETLWDSILACPKQSL